MCGRWGTSSMTTTCASGARSLLGGYHGERQPTSSTRSAPAASDTSPPTCSGWSYGKFAHTADCGSITGIASSSASSTSARNASGSRPADSVRMTGLLASASLAATASISEDGLSRAPLGATFLRTLGRCQGASSASRPTLRYTGPLGCRTASSPARITDSYRVVTSGMCPAHLVNGAATTCGPPTNDRFRYHCDPGSGPSPSP